MVTKVTYVGDDFTRKPPKYERFIRPMVCVPSKFFFVILLDIFKMNPLVPTEVSLMEGKHSIVLKSGNIEKTQKTLVLYVFYLLQDVDFC